MSELHAGAPVRVSGVTMIPVEKVSRDRYPLRQGFWMYLAKEPVAVVICDAGGRRALDLSGRELELARLFADVPGLEETVARFDRRETEA